MRRVDERHALGGLGERRNGRVDGIATHDQVVGGLEGVRVVGAVHLQGAPREPGGLGGGQQHAYVGVGCDDGRDVTPFDHDAALCGQGTLPADELLAHAEVGRHGADRGRDVGRPDRLADVVAVDQHVGVLGVGAELQRQLAGQGGDPVGVGEVDVARQRPPGERAVHRAGVDETQAQPLGHAARHAGLSRARRSVDRDDEGTGTVRGHAKPLTKGRGVDLVRLPARQECSCHPPAIPAWRATFRRVRGAMAFGRR